MGTVPPWEPLDPVPALPSVNFPGASISILPAAGWQFLLWGERWVRCGEGADSDSEQRPGAPTLTLLSTSPVPWQQCHPARAAKRPPPPPGGCLPPPLPCPGEPQPAFLQPPPPPPPWAQQRAGPIGCSWRTARIVLSTEALGRTTTNQTNKADPKEANLQVLPARGRVLEPSCRRCAMGKPPQPLPGRWSWQWSGFLGGERDQQEVICSEKPSPAWWDPAGVPASPANVL